MGSLVRLYQILVVALLILVGAARGSALAQYKIDTWTTEHGLPQSSLISVAQTPDGFIWATTLGGLVRFDGVRFRVYDTSTNPELPTSRLGGMLSDESGALWIGGDGQGLLRFRDGSFKTMGSADGLPEGQTIRRIKRGDRQIFETRSGSVIIEKNGQIVPDTRPGPSSDLGLTYIGDGPAEVRWFVDAEGLARRYDGGRLTRTVSLPADRGPRVYEDSAGRVWMRNLKTGGLLRLTANTLTHFGRADGVTHLSTLWPLEAQDGSVWFASDSGLVRFRDGRFRTFTKADGLPDNNVNSVFQDREGLIWVATQRGLARMTEQPVTTFSVEQGLAARNTYPVLQDRRGDVWIGGWTGLTRYRNGVFDDATRPLGAERGMVLSLAEAPDGSILVGLYSGEVRRLTVAGPEARITAAHVVSRPSPAYALHQTPAGDIWIAGDAGAVRFHDGVVDPVLPGTKGAAVFFHDGQGALWIGGADGVVRYTTDGTTSFGAAEGFTGKRTRAIHASADGTLWFGTYDTGLFRYRDGIFTRYTTAEGLPTNGAFEILEDEQKRFWISSNSGIYRVAKAELDDVAAGRRRRVTAVRYGRDDGMVNAECNGLGRPAGIRAQDGKMWFPTQDGVVVIDPRKMGRQVAPPVAILDAAVDGIPVPRLDRIEIRSGSRSVDVHYAALTFVRPELAQFKYRMENLETEWHDDTGSDRIARYARLPYGDYRFRVIAANRDGVWNEQGASIIVNVVPPFWRTNWFMALMIAVVMTAGFGAHKVRLAVLERQAEVQQAFARQLIDSQETDRKRIAAELHDGVSQTLVVIRNWSQMSERSLPDDSAERRRLGQIASAATQALGEVREVVQDLVPYHLERMGLVDAIREAAARVADASGIPIDFRADDVNAAVTTETALRVYRVVQEGLNNIVKHSGATSAALAIVLEAGRVRLTLKDNGKGFDPSAVSPTTAGDGFGLVGISERTRMMGGEFTVDSSPGRGTAISIVVPATHVDSHPDR